MIIDDVLVQLFDLIELVRMCEFEGGSPYKLMGLETY
jgi:hypothetical protein